MNMLSMLKQPAPISHSWKSKMGMALFFGVFVFLFLFIFRPFELDQLPLARMLWISSAYGAITFTCVFTCSSFIPKLAPGFFREETWTTGKEILIASIVLVIVGLANYLVSPLFVHTKLSVRDAIWFQGITLSVGFLPIAFLILFRQNRLLNTFRENAKLLEKKLQEKNELQWKVEKEKKTEPEIITIEGDYQNEKIAVAADQLYMVQSANNYIKVYFEQKASPDDRVVRGKVAYSIIRLTLKKAEDILSVNGMFFRCHRTCIINLDKIMHVEGNAQGYKVTMEGIEEMIPISRNFSAEFSDRLLAVRRQAG